MAAGRVLTPPGPPPAGPAERRVHLVQGEFRVSGDPDVVLATLLGSCVAACLHDPVAGIGGMNHFLLPGGDSGGEPECALRYGVHAMELLINGMLRAGGRRDRLAAKLFGGASVLGGLTDIGRQNADFAESFLRRERIAVSSASLLGRRGRRVHFWPHSGRARQMLLDRGEEAVLATQRSPAVDPPAAGDLELF